MNTNKQKTENTGAPEARPEAQMLRFLNLNANNSPKMFAMMIEPPEVDVKCNVNAKHIKNTEEDEEMDDGLHEVALNIETEANIKKDNQKILAFRCEMEYVGLFTLKNLTKEQKEQALLIEAPTLLFPFARRIIATATTDAGFPPLMLAPINFAAKYMEEKEDQQNSETEE